MTKKEIFQKIRLVEVSQNSWELENLLLLTTLTDEQISIVLTPLIEEERANDTGEVIYDNDTMVQMLGFKYPKDFILSYGEPDYLTI
jgi:hypothetical protein